MKKSILIILFFAFNVSKAEYSQSSINPVYPGKVNVNSNHNIWDLSKPEWDKYQSLMKGEAGLFYSNRTPYYVLAAYEKDIIKKKEYAKKVLEIKKKFHEQTLSIYEIQKQIVKENYQITKKSKKNIFTPSIKMGRKIMFVKLDCLECDKKIISLSKDKSQFDIYVVGAQSDDEIRKWANKINLPVEKIKSKKITLNHGNSLSKNIGVKVYPSEYMYDGEKYYKVKK